jgi:large subunit ribosomal protein L19e
MDLTKKKELASKALKVGKNKIIFDSERISEIKEAITKQDIRELYAEGVIRIRPTPGRKKLVKRKTKRRAGKIKQTLNTRKQDYVKLTRKLRAFIKSVYKTGKIDDKTYKTVRNKIRMKEFKSKANLKEYLKHENR